MPADFRRTVTRYFNTVSQQAAAGGTGSAAVGTQNELIAQDFGTVLRINPRIDLSTGLIRAQIELIQTTQMGLQTVAQSLTSGDSVQQVNTQLPSVAKVRDLYSVAQLLGNTPTTPMDYLLVEKFEPVALGEVQLGASRVCLQSLGQPGVVFREPSFERLLQGLHTLAQRVDVEMGNVRLSVSENPDDGSTQAQALVSPLCLILRAEEGKAS